MVKRDKMLQIILATKNENKVLELAEILAGLNVKLLTLKDFPECPDVIEDGKMFEENSLKKADFVFKYTGILALADDSGLEVDILNGEPGIYSARFSGENASSKKNNEKLLSLLKDIPFEKRDAQFHCALALVGKDISETTEGICKGKILNEYRGTGGFGYDPLFLYEPLNLTFAEMPAEEKNKISHRSIAFRKMRSIIEKLR